MSADRTTGEGDGRRLRFAVVRFLVIGNVTAAAGAALVRHGHAVVAPDSLAIAADTAAGDILTLAGKQQLDVITGDAAIARAPFAAGAAKFGRSIVHLSVEAADIEQDEAVDRLFARYPRLAGGRIYVVTDSRVKIRQLPSARTTQVS